MKTRLWHYYLLALSIILLDQALKLWVYHNMQMGSSGIIPLLGSWFKLHYTLNPGMAFGIQFGFKYGKLILTLGRLMASVAIGYYMWRLWKHKVSIPYHLWGWALLLGGAIGNLVDSTFYALMLDNAPYNAPMLLFHGQVIDMLHIDLWNIQLPQWVPIFGNEYLPSLPIFNLADTAIMTGILLIYWTRQQFMKQCTEALPDQGTTDDVPTETLE